jgi:hypothetical protein
VAQLLSPPMGPCFSAVASAPAAFRVRVWEVMSRGQGLVRLRDRRGQGPASGSGPAYSQYFKQIAKAVVLHRP